MRTKMKSFMRKCLPKTKKISASELKIKTNKLLSKCLLKTAIKTQVLGKPLRRKLGLLTEKLTRQVH